MKKRGFGMGRFNGFGGKPEEGESMTTCAIRELHEESGLVTSKVDQVGFMVFSFQDKPLMIKIFVYIAQDYEGTPVETEEMRPQWFPVSQIPYDQMWPDDRHWMPMLLEGKSFFGRVDMVDDDEIDECTFRET